MEPSMEEMMVAGTVNSTLFKRFLFKPRRPFSGIPDQAVLKLSRLMLDGRLHILLRSCTSAKVLSELLNMTYTGIRKMMPKRINSR
jgi:hypothetical protein